MCSIQQFIGDILDKVVIELNREENMNKIKENVLAPMVEYIFKRLYPYIVATSIIFILTFILAGAIFYMVFKANIE
tara:strand:+ start:212 stop:439 length:228 start_codon:yes stop_codon:yes gene_type:complete